MSLKDRPLIVFLSGIVAAWLSGFLAYQWLDTKIKASVEQVPHLKEDVAAIERQLAQVKAQAEGAQRRLDGLVLTESAQVSGNPYGVDTATGPPGPLYFMVGIQDGTGGGHLSANFYKQVGLNVPPR